MKTNDFFDKFECKKDDKARRVLNVAPDKPANVTADALENGMTLEALQGIGVPVLRYSTQITIHGLIPAFNDTKRVGGYRNLIRNGNGSVGVKYGAIDAAKKDLIARSARATGGKWHPFTDSSGLCLQATFKDRGEAIAFAEAAKGAASMVYGSLHGICLPWGAGYMICLFIGAIPQESLWPFILSVTGIDCLASLDVKEAARKAEQEAKDAERQVWINAHNAEREAEQAAKLALLMEKAVKLNAPIAAGRLLVLRNTGDFLIAKLETIKGRMFAEVESGYGRKLCKDGFPWPKSLAAGRVYLIN